MEISSKIVSREQATVQCQAWREDGQHVVFTNGCFDILHKGHITYLASARELGDQLVIGLNSDSSTRRLKGSSRPINDQEARAFLLAALSMVDMVVIFDEDTPKALIEAVQPQTLVKGGDYAEDAIVGGSFVKAHGGQVVIIPFLEGYSTTSIEMKIKALNSDEHK